MKKTPWQFLALYIALGLLAVGGCHKTVAPATPPPPGAVNQFDATSYRVISDAQAAITSVKTDVQSGKLVLNTAQTKVFNQIIADYNVAENLWKAYHGGATGDQASLATAIGQLVTDISQLTTQIQQAYK